MEDDMTRSDIETAERLGRKRARMWPVLAFLFVAQQGAYFSIPADDAARAVDHVRVGAWVVLSAVLLLILATGGFWRHSKAVRALLNDEVSRAHRAEAMSLGFIVSMVFALVLYATVGLEAVSVRQAIHIIVSMGIVTALIRFAMLERRALGDG